MQRRILILAVIFSLLAVLPLSPARAEPRCFPEAAPAIQNCIDGRFRSYWEQQGGLPVFGYPLSAPYQKQTDVGLITIQLFERAQMELHPDNTPPYDVQLGHLGREILARQGGAPSPPEQPREGCLFVPETGQNICPPFLDTWNRFGLELGAPGVSMAESVALFGLPLTPAHPETLSDGQTYTVQWFERARMEDHGSQGVLLGLLGHQTDPPPPQALTWQNPYGPQEPGGFIQVSGSELTRLGQPVRLKGVNYYPQWRPWSEMWDRWDSQQIQRELQLARDQLGINAVRILLPYGAAGGDGDVDRGLLEKMRQITKVAGDLDLRLIVTLFDFYNTFPGPNSKTERKNVEYLEKLIGNFAGDDRIIAWDLHNEPDNYEKWTQGDADEVLTWLGRMADVVHRLAPNHLVTVGMANYHNLWQPGPDGRSVLDYSDVISMHTYNAADTQRQLDEIRTHTSKPILIEEFGWPSGPPCYKPGYTEAQQAEVYRQIVQAAEGRAAGVFAWTLRDYDAGPTTRWDTQQEHYGLYRPDDSLKPAAVYLQAFAAAPLPSLTRIDATIKPDDPPGPDRGSGGKKSVMAGGSGYYVKDMFRRAWDTLGGQGTLGLPLSNAFVRPEDGMIVQYFEAAVLELHAEAQFDPDFLLLPEPEQIMRLVRPAYLGYVYRPKDSFPPPESPPPDSRYFPETGYHVKGQFWSAYENLLGLWRFGAPLSGEMVEQVNGIEMTVQYFEKGRLELNPQFNQIVPGQLGTWAWQLRCSSMQ